MSNPNAIVAKLHNQASYEEGEATGDLSPGTGCVVYEEDGEKYVRAAEAGEKSSRVVREARNMPRGLGEHGESPLSQDIPDGEWAETVGFNRHDQARMRADGGVSGGDEVGYDDDGHLTAGDEETDVEPVARVRETYEVDGESFATVEFL